MAIRLPCLQLRVLLIKDYLTEPPATMLVHQLFQLVHLFRLTVKFIRLRAIRRFRTYLDEDEDPLPPNYLMTLFIEYAKCIITVLKLYRRRKYKKRLSKPHLLLRLLTGYRYMYNVNCCNYNDKVTTSSTDFKAVR